MGWWRVMMRRWSTTAMTIWWIGHGWSSAASISSSIWGSFATMRIWLRMVRIRTFWLYSLLSSGRTTKWRRWRLLIRWHRRLERRTAPRRCSRGTRRVLSNLDPFHVVIVVPQQVLSIRGVVLFDSSSVPALVDWPKDTNLLSDHTLCTKPELGRDIVRVTEPLLLSTCTRVALT